MARRAPPASRRSTRNWIARGVLALVVGGFAIGALARDCAQVLRRADPARAHALAPGDARISAARAQQLLGNGAAKADRLRAAGLARDALRHDMTVVDAVATLGIDAQLRGDQSGARQLFGYAERLSRRHLATQLFRIEDAVARDDVAQAVHHYDIALRTSRQATNLLFPIMGAAIGEQSIRAALVQALDRDPTWGASCIQYVAADGPEPVSTAALLRELQRVRVAVPAEAQAALVKTLVSQHEMAQAWNYYRSFRPGAQRSASRDPDFAADLADPTPFDWTATNDAGLSATIVRDRRGGMVDFIAPGGVGGSLVQQVQVLPAGRYRLEGHSRSIEQPANSHPYWMLGCRDGAEIGRVDVPNSSVADGKFAGVLTVPAGCPVQVLALVARPSDAAGGLAGQIDHLVLAPDTGEKTGR